MTTKKARILFMSRHIIMAALSVIQLPGKSRIVGAVYDRAFLVESAKRHAVIDRAYSERSSLRQDRFDFIHDAIHFLDRQVREARLSSYRRRHL